MKVRIRKWAEESLVVDLEVIPKNGELIKCKLPNTATSLLYEVVHIIHCLVNTSNGVVQIIHIIVKDTSLMDTKE